MALMGAQRQVEIATRIAYHLATGAARWHQRAFRGPARAALRYGEAREERRPIAVKTAERTRIAFQRGVPDRVPFHCWLGLPLI